MASVSAEPEPVMPLLEAAPGHAVDGVLAAGVAVVAAGDVALDAELAPEAVKFICCAACSFALLTGFDGAIPQGGGQAAMTIPGHPVNRTSSTGVTKRKTRQYCDCPRITTSIQRCMATRCKQSSTRIYLALPLPAKQT